MGCLKNTEKFKMHLLTPKERKFCNIYDRCEYIHILIIFNVRHAVKTRHY